MTSERAFYRGVANDPTEWSVWTQRDDVANIPDPSADRVFYKTPNDETPHPNWKFEDLEEKQDEAPTVGGVDAKEDPCCPGGICDLNCLAAAMSKQGTQTG